jgi:hypothetical protein
MRGTQASGALLGYALHPKARAGLNNNPIKRYDEE